MHDDSFGTSDRLVPAQLSIRPRACPLLAVSVLSVLCPVHVLPVMRSARFSSKPRSLDPLRRAARAAEV